MKENIKMLVIDDDPGILDALQLLFDIQKDDLPEYELYSNVKDFRKAVTPNVHICVVDYRMPGVNTLSLIQEVFKSNPYCWFIMFSGQKDCKVIIEFMNEVYGTKYVEKGANDSIDKLIFYIKDIVNKLTVIESYFHESFTNNQKLSEVTKTLSNLKNDL